MVAYNEHGDGALTGEVSANASGVDGTAPTLTNATVVGSTLTLNWNEELDTTSVPATSAFAVNVNGTQRGISGIGIAGRVVTLTLATAAKTGDTLTVSYTPPSEAGAKAIRDVVQNNAAAFSARTVGNETVIEIEVVSIAITSDPGPDGVYTYGKGGGSTRETIEATVTFTENVTVTGTPELPVRMAIGVGVPSASLHLGYLFKKRPNLVYHSGSGTASLTFRRAVEEGDSNPDGISVPAGDIRLNGGTIRGGSGRDAVLTHEGLVAQSGHRVDGVRPTLARATRDTSDHLSTAGTGSAVVNGNTITLIYNKALDETEVPTPGYGFKVYVGGTRSAVYLAGVDGGTAQTVSDIAVNGNKVTLTLAAPVAADAEVRVDYEVPYYRRSAAITDAVGNQARNFYSDVIDNVTVAAGAANVTALALASSPGADRAYAIGDAIDVRVTYSTSVTVDTTNGTPTLLGLRVGSAARTAAYSGGSGTAELTFRYTVAEDDADADGVSIVSEYIALNGGTIGTGSSGVAAARTHSGLAAQLGHLVDGERPTLSSASVDGTTLTLDWSEPLDTASVPATSRFPIYVNGRQRGYQHGDCQRSGDGNRAGRYGGGVGEHRDADVVVCRGVRGYGGGDLQSGDPCGCDVGPGCGGQRGGARGPPGVRAHRPDGDKRDAAGPAGGVDRGPDQSCDRGGERGLHADADRVGLGGADGYGRGDGKRRDAGADVSCGRDLRGGVGHGGARTCNGGRRGGGGREHGHGDGHGR